MPTVASNKGQWNDAYDWNESGDEWSREWGGADMQWFGTLLPRLHAFLPAGSILEIAPGYGRWTQFLLEHCDQLIGVDLSEKCIEACKQRFSSSEHAEFHANDGTSLAMIADESLDLVFSFDSLVHVEDEVLGAYLEQLAGKMRQDAIGFIHHSNLGECLSQYRFLRSSKIGSKVARRLGLIEKYEHWRGRSVSASRFESLASKVGLACITQEKIPWHGNPHPIDCISTFTPRGSRWARPNRVFHNADFLRDAKMWNTLAKLYGMAAMPAMAGNRPNEASTLSS